MEQRRREPLRAPRTQEPAEATAKNGPDDSAWAAPPSEPGPPSGQGWGATSDGSFQAAPLPVPAQGYPSSVPSSAGKRFGAYVLDAALAIITLFIGWFIWSLVIWSKGQSPAKSILGMRCISTETGRAAGWGTMALRELIGKSLLGTVTFGITTIVSAFLILGESRQGIWDKIANTVVVDDPDGRLVA